jgi:hypothetical protein
MNNVRRFVSGLLMAIGLAIVGVGVTYWWKEWPYAVLVLRILSGYGGFAIGTGALVRPGPAGLSLAAAACLGLSSALLFSLWFTTPWAATLYLTFAVASGVGALAGVGLFVFKRKRAQ